MVQLPLHEAQLFRVLVGIFGLDNVMYSMSILAVCGGVVPDVLRDRFHTEAESWAKKHKCMFTVIDGNGTPKLIVDFSATARGIIDVSLLEQHNVSRGLFAKLGLPYVTVSEEEFNLALDSDEENGLVELLHSKIGV